MSDPLAFLAGGGEAARMIRGRDWSDHPLDRAERWPPEFRAALSLVLNSPESMILAWGAELSFFFNDAYSPLLGPRLAWAMGERFDKVWADGWAQAAPIIDEAFAGRSRRFKDLPWKLGTDRGVADTWWSFAYSRVLDGAGRVAGLFIFTNETTDRVLKDAALRETQARLQRAQEAGGVGLFTVDAEDDVVHTTPEFCRLYGLPEREDHAAAAIERLVVPEDAPLVSSAASRREGRVVRDVEYRIRRADTGEERWIARRGEIESDAGGRPARFAGVVRDVTRRKRLEGELRALTETLEQRVAERTAELMRAEAQLRQSQKMEAVGQLTGGIAHDFNNLLQGIAGSLELLENRLAQGRIADVDRYVAAARGAAKRAAALTHRLLAFSRQQTLDPRAVDLNRLVAGMEDLVRRTVGPLIALEVVAAGGLWPTLVDPNQLENALLNLCVNARDAMPDGGRITVETANRWLDDRAARERDLPPGQYVSLCVSDTGAGMPPEVAAKAFDPFFTTKEVGKGTGLGLSMVYGFVRQSGGQARIYSEAGQGTVVCLYLPRHAGAAEEADDKPTVLGPPRAQAGRTVLVVDDEPTMRMLAADVLQGIGFAVVEVSDAASALQVLRSDARVDLLVTDVGLPGGVDGRQLADAAWADRPGLKVLFITGFAENAMFGNGRLEHGMHVMTKPFAMEALAVRVRELTAAS